LLPVYLIIENSKAYTGAIKAAIKQALVLESNYRFVFVLPRNSDAVKYVSQQRFKFYQLPIREISRSPMNLLLYLPALLFNSFRLKKILRKEKASFLQVNDYYNLLGVMVRLLGFKGRLITYVRLLPSAMPGFLSRIWIMLAQRYSHSVIAVSDAVLKQLPPKANTIRIYDPVELPENYTDDKSMLTSEEVRFLYLANYTRGKGQELAIAAFAVAYRQQRNIRLHFYGGDMGLQKNRDFRRELEEEVKRLGLAEVIRFNDFASDTEAIIKSYDVMLNFSQAESFSMTCAEASYYGRPVIATKCGGPEEIIVNNKTGLLVNVNAVDEMSDAILQLAADKNQRIRMGMNGRQYVRDKFRVTEFMNQLVRLVL
jgi:glycosyltransferase involved in cell wall biosynthesis